MTDLSIRLAQTVNRTATLGPFSRFALWVQGCERRCAGCVSPEMQPLQGGYVKSVLTLADEILTVQGIEGVTISGGEPFLQEEALCLLCDSLREGGNLGIILYTGYEFSEIRRRALTLRCDAIIDGPYIPERDDGLSLRGSSNQCLRHITGRYRGLIAFGSQSRQTELLSNREGGVSMVGVPSKHDRDVAAALREFLK